MSDETKPFIFENFETAISWFADSRTERYIAWLTERRDTYQKQLVRCSETPEIYRLQGKTQELNRILAVEGEVKEYKKKVETKTQ
jgi:hypothetical protein